MPRMPRYVVLLGLVLALSIAGCTEQPSRPRDGSAGDIDGGGTSPSDGGPLPDRVIPDSGFGEVCEVATAFAEPLPATLMFQLDTSGSMNCGANDRSCLTGDPTPSPSDSRWDVFRMRLVEALAALPDSTRAGLMHYPRTGGSCPSTTPLVSITELTASRAQIGTALNGLTPEGITPTHDAVENALAILRADTGERPVLVLATDGAATVCFGCDAGCSFDDQDDDDEDLVTRIGAAAAAGIPPDVFGVPGSQSFRGILSRMATMGGTARAGCSDGGPVYCHYDLTDPGLDFATGLRDALAAIGEAVVSCEYEIPENPDGAFDATRVNVVVTDEGGTEDTIPRDTSRANGWDYSEDGTRIILHGAACDRAEALRGGRIDVQFGCPTILI